jgi:hypothetical protein
MLDWLNSVVEDRFWNSHQDQYVGDLGFKRLFYACYVRLHNCWPQLLNHNTYSRKLLTIQLLNYTTTTTEPQHLLTKTTDHNYWPHNYWTTQLLTITTEPQHLLTKTTDHNYWPHNYWTTQLLTTTTEPQHLLTKTTDHTTTELHNYWPLLQHLLTKTTDHNYWPHNYWTTQLLTTTTQLLNHNTYSWKLLNYTTTELHNYSPQPQLLNHNTYSRKLLTTQLLNYTTTDHNHTTTDHNYWTTQILTKTTNQK